MTNCCIELESWSKRCVIDMKINAEYVKCIIKEAIEKGHDNIAIPEELIDVELIEASNEWLVNLGYRATHYRLLESIVIKLENI